MRAAAPEAKEVRDVLALEHLAEAAVVVEEGVVFAHDELDVELPQRGELLRLVDVGQVVVRRVEVDVLVVIAVEQIPEVLDGPGQIVAPAQRDDSAKQLRMTQRDVDGA